MLKGLLLEKISKYPDQHRLIIININFISVEELFRHLQFLEDSSIQDKSVSFLETENAFHSADVADCKQKIADWMKYGLWLYLAMYLRQVQNDSFQIQKF